LHLAQVGVTVVLDFAQGETNGSSTEFCSPAAPTTSAVSLNARRISESPYVEGAHCTARGRIRKALVAQARISITPDCSAGHHTCGTACTSKKIGRSVPHRLHRLSRLLSLQRGSVGRAFRPPRYRGHHACVSRLLPQRSATAVETNGGCLRARWPCPALSGTQRLIDKETKTPRRILAGGFSVHK